MKKTVIITGAAGGIGSACVHRLAESGHRIIAVSRSEDGLHKLKKDVMERHKVILELLQVDFMQKGFAEKLETYIKEQNIFIDALINNAGLLVNRSFEQQTKEEINDQIQINYTAPLEIIRALLPYMKRGEEVGHVVNISSMGGFQGSSKFPGLSIYSSTKAALSSLTECLAAEYSEDGPAFNCLALGSARTAMLQKAFPEYESPMTPERIAEFIVDFALKGHRYFNGKVLPLAGVMT